ncbi:MAG: hypothetical protein HQL70_11755 [Magnetococcales bacterium]|nr:hypothetical protein [Magnetococcales bacterium]
MSNKKVKDPDPQWDLFSSGAIIPLLRLIELWAAEENVAKEVIIRRLASILVRSNEYVMVYQTHTVPDPNVAHLLERVLKDGNWNNIGANAYDKQLLKSFHGGNKKVADKLDNGKKAVLACDLSVDCDTLFEVISEFGLPTPQFLRLIVGESPTKLVTSILAEPQPAANVEQPLLSVKDFCIAYPSFREGGIRHYIFHEKSNGLLEHGAVKRVGRKVLIDVKQFFAWAQANGKTA